MKKVFIIPNFSPYLAIRIAAIRLRRRDTHSISSLPADSNTRVSILLTAKTDTDSFDTTVTLLAALR
jgi:hypothetical protein